MTMINSNFLPRQLATQNSKMEQQQQPEANSELQKESQTVPKEILSEQQAQFNQDFATMQDAISMQNMAMLATGSSQDNVEVNEEPEAETNVGSGTDVNSNTEINDPEISDPVDETPVDETPVDEDPTEEAPTSVTIGGREIKIPKGWTYEQTASGGVILFNETEESYKSKEYDSNGKITKQTVVTKGPDGRSTTLNYNDDGEVIKKEVINGDRKTTTVGNKTTVEEGKLTRTYVDGKLQERQEIVVDSETGKTTTYKTSYEEVDGKSLAKTKTKEIKNNDKYGSTTTVNYQLDANGNKTGSTVTREYGSSGLKQVTVKDADGNTTVKYYNGETELESKADFKAALAALFPEN